MLNLYFVRHGQTEWNKDKRLQGKQDSELTQIGVKQAIALGEHLAKKGIKIDKYYSSPQKRAYDTAKLISRGEEVTKRENLCEIGFGEWEGRRLEDIKGEHFEAFDNFFSKAHLYDPNVNNGEGYEEVEARVRAELDYITSTHQDKTLLCVSHGITLKMLFKILNDHSLEEFWNSEVLENSSLSLITYDQGKFNIEYISNTEHLEGGLSTFWKADE